jgi:hypothetical protein
MQAFKTSGSLSFSHTFSRGAGNATSPLIVIATSHALFNTLEHHIAWKGNARASDPKVGTGFGTNPMLKQNDRAASLISFESPPL